MGQKVILKKSNVEGKIPSANTMDFGEVYVNYASGNCNSFLATKKYDGTVAQFMERQHTDKVSMLAYKTKSDDLDGRWNVDISGVTEYYEGFSFNIRLEKSYNITYNVINVNGLGYKFVFSRRGTRLTSLYGKYSELRLTYRTNASDGVKASFNLENIISGVTYKDGFVIENYYDSTYVDALRNTYAANQTSERITRYQLLVLDSDNRLMPLTLVPTGNYNTGGKPVNTRGFRPDKIFYYASTTIVAANSNLTSHSYLYETYSTNTGAYTFNSSLTAYRQIYLCGTYDSETDLFYLETGLTSFYVLVPSNTSGLTLSNYFTSGKDYIYLGSTYSSANYYALFANHPLYHFDGTNLIRHEYSTIIEDELVTAIALNDINTRLNVISGYAASRQEASEYAGAALANAIVYTENVSGYIYTALTDDEQVISAALCDLDERLTSMSTTTISLIRDELLSISATIDTVLSESLTDFSGNIISEIIKDEYAIATSLTDLDSRIREMSGNVQDANYISSSSVYTSIYQLDDRLTHNYATSADVYNSISAGGGGGGGDISGYATSADTYNAINGIQTGILSNYATSADTYNAINGIQTGILSNYATKAEASEYAAAALSNSLDYTDSSLQSYATSSNTYNSIESHTSNSTIHFTSGDVKTQIEAYGYTTNIGTVTGVSINGSTKSPTSGLVTLGTVLTGYTETDPTVPNWAKASSKPSYTASEVGALPTGTTLDGISDGSTRKLSDYATTGNLDTLSSQTVSHIQSAILHLPTVTASDNGKILRVVNGTWALVDTVSIFSGNTEPSNLLGNNGDIYLQA